MEKLAHIIVTDSELNGQRSVKIIDIQDVLPTNNGSVIKCYDGRTIETASTVQVVHDLIDAIWTEYTTALGNP